MCAALGATLASPRRSIASVASAPGRVKRVAVRKSRSSSHRRATAASPRSVADSVTAAEPRRTAAANAPRAAARRADVAVARRVLRVVQGRLRIAVGRGVGAVDRVLEAVGVRLARLAHLGGRGGPSPVRSSIPAARRPLRASDAAFHGSVAEKASSANASAATVATSGDDGTQTSHRRGG